MEPFSFSTNSHLPTLPTLNHSPNNNTRSIYCYNNNYTSNLNSWNNSMNMNNIPVHHHHHNNNNNNNQFLVNKRNLPTSTSTSTSTSSSPTSSSSSSSGSPKIRRMAWTSRKKRQPSSSLRKKSKKKNEPSNIKFKKICHYFNLPLELAAGRLTISPSHLKKVCRRSGISKWPFRQLNKVKYQIQEAWQRRNRNKNPEINEKRIESHLQERVNYVTRCLSFKLSKEDIENLLSSLDEDLPDGCQMSHQIPLGTSSFPSSPVPNISHSSSSFSPFSSPSSLASSPSSSPSASPSNCSSSYNTHDNTQLFERNSFSSPNSEYSPSRNDVDVDVNVDGGVDVKPKRLNTQKGDKAKDWRQIVSIAALCN